MTSITLNIDETQQAQVVYSPELDAHLRIYALTQAEIDTETKQAQDRLDAAQKDLDAMAALNSARTTAVASGPVGTALPPGMVMGG